MSTRTFPLASIRGNDHTSAITITRGQYTCSVAVNGREILSKIFGCPWTVAEGVDPWELADAARALCEQA